MSKIIIDDKDEEYIEISTTKEIERIRDRQILKKGALYGALIAVIAMLVILAIAILGIKIATKDSNALTFGNLKRMIEVESTVNSEYRGEINQSQLKDYMIKGYVAGLGDPYAAYFAEDDLEGYSQDIQGDYVGLGIVLANEEGSADIIIREVYEDAPAEKAGILAGDILKKVNDKDVSKMDISDIIANEIGKELGTKVALTVARDGKQLTFNTEISRITIKTIDYKMLEDKIGYIKIAEFNQKTTNQFEKALDELTKQEMKGLVIDLRNNPGGLVSSASDMLNMLLPKGVIVTEKDKNNKIIAQVNSDGKHEFKLPLVVLINENSASSSEIFAGALRDYDMCTLVGEKTFGKGIIQGMFELSDGTILKITTSEYFLPKGESIHDKGIEPDVKVKNEPDSDNEEQSKDGKNQADSDKEEQSKDGKNQEQSEKDNQLDRAVEIVKEKISE